MKLKELQNIINTLADDRLDDIEVVFKVIYQPLSLVQVKSIEITNKYISPAHSEKEFIIMLSVQDLDTGH